MRSSSPFLVLRLESIHNLLLRGRQFPISRWMGTAALCSLHSLGYTAEWELCHLPQFFISVTHSSLWVCPGTGWRTRHEFSKHPCVFLTPFGSYMHVTAEDEGLWSICISTPDEIEEYRGWVSAKNALERKKKKKLNSTWKKARYINRLTIQVSVSSK